MTCIKIMIGMQTSDGFTVSWDQMGPFFLFLRRSRIVVVEQSENLDISDEPVVVVALKPLNTMCV